MHELPAHTTGACTSDQPCITIRSMSSSRPFTLRRALACNFIPCPPWTGGFSTPSLQRGPDEQPPQELQLGPEEWAQLVDDKARALLGMSGEEFEQRLKSGEIDIDDSPEVTRVAMMLPLNGTRK